MTGMPGFWPCTPYGCMKMLESIGYDLRGKHAVVIGRSNIVGKPMAMMLLQQNATVTICHSATPDLKAMTLQADVIVAAVGKRNVLTADMVKPGAVVIDVGMNRNDEGKLCGDVDFAGVRSGRLDHPGARRRGPHDPRHAAGQHPGRCRARPNRAIGRFNGQKAVQLNGAVPQNSGMSNPLLDFSDLPLFDRITPGDVAPAIDSCWPTPTRRWKPSPHPDFPADWTAISSGAGRGHRAPGPRLGRRQPPQRRGRHARAARRLQRAPAQASPSSGPDWAPTSACTPSTRPSTRGPERRTAPGPRNAMRNFRAVGAELQGEAKERFARSRSARPS
jgi:hypothetical protein